MRRALVTACVLAFAALAPPAPAQAPPVLDLERLTGLQAQQLMNEGKLTSVQLTQAYIDRIVALMGTRDSIREVISFPKTASGGDPLTGAPAPVDEQQLRELGLRSTAPPKPA